jgi:hypothetical protein
MLQPVTEKHTLSQNYVSPKLKKEDSSMDFSDILYFSKNSSLQAKVMKKTLEIKENLQKKKKIEQLKYKKMSLQDTGMPQITNLQAL